MKQIYKIVILILLFLAVGFLTHAQEEEEKNKKERKKDSKKENTELIQEEQETEEEECKVLLPSISDSYEGKCKKGLAHGKGKATGIDTYQGDFRKGYPNGHGIFTYQNGDVYDGRFKNGLKDGEGTMTTTIENRDTILSGIWVDDFFVGPKPKHPVVKYKYGIDSYSFKKVREGERFVIEIYLNGMINNDLEDFIIVSTSGTEFQLGNGIGFENITFPVVCKVSYKTWNKLRSSRHECIFEFEIPEPGEWKIRIIN